MAKPSPKRSSGLRWPPEPRQQVHLEHLYFRQRYQGQGFGTAVLKQVFVDADRQSMDVRVGALRDSDANRFYARHGFVLVEQSEWDLYYVRRHRDGSEGRIV
jgi:GNAT superfamily N-acetyltransferase